MAPVLVLLIQSLPVNPADTANLVVSVTIQSLIGLTNIILT